MRVALVLAAIVALASCGAFPGSGEHHRTVADKTFLQKQKDILRLLVRIQQPNYYKDQAEIAQTYDIEANINNYRDPKVVKRFLAAYHRGLLPKGEPFTPYYKQYRDDAHLLYDVFYFARDYDTFYKTACWARDHVNEGQFLYSFSIAVFQRQDLNDIVLPPVYEIYPYLFVDAEVINQAYVTYQHDAPLKTHKTQVFPANYTVHYPEDLLSYFTEDVGLNTYYTYLYYNYPTFLNSTYYGVHFDRRGELFYYTRQQLYARYYLERLSNGLPDVEPFNYYLPLQTAYNPNLRWSNGQQVPVRGSDAFFQHYYSGKYGGTAGYTLDGNYYVHNHYYRTTVKGDNIGHIGNIGNVGQIGNIGNIGQIGTYKPVNVFAGTYNDQYAQYDQFYPEDVQTLEKRVRDAIDYGLFFSQERQNAKNIDLYEDYQKGIDAVGSVIEGNADSPFRRYYGSLYHYYRMMTGFAVDQHSDNGLAPTALENIYTALRDPANYQIYKRINYFFQKYKNYLPRYTHEELEFPGVKVENVDVGKLITYFDYFEIDLDNVINVNNEEAGQHLDYRARQVRLNHKPFTYKIQVNSEKAQDVMVRIYLGPKYDYLGREFDINEKRHYFVEIDHFPYQVQAGQTLIERNSRDSNVISHDHPSYRTLFRKVNEAYEGKGQYYIDQDDHHCGYPERLLLPKGKKGGQVFTFYVIVTPYHKQEDADFQPYNYKAFSYCGTGANRKFPDDKPMGYPFDRYININDFYTSNQYFKDVVIFHKKQEEVNAATDQ